LFCIFVLCLVFFTWSSCKLIAILFLRRHFCWCLTVYCWNLRSIRVKVSFIFSSLKPFLLAGLKPFIVVCTFTLLISFRKYCHGNVKINISESSLSNFNKWKKLWNGLYAFLTTADFIDSCLWWKEVFNKNGCDLL